MSDLKTTWMATWAQLKNRGGTAGLPVLPPLVALVELSVLVAAIVIIDWSFPGLGFLTLEPSPFWVPVLLLSLQYGTVAGLIAAAAATAAYVFNGVAEQAVGENFFSYLLRIWALPILWIGVALVLGQFRLRQIAEKQGLRQNLAKRTGEAQQLASYAKDLEARCHRLERQLSTRNAAPVKPVLDVLAQVMGQAVMGQAVLGQAVLDKPAGINAALAAIAQQLWPGAQVSVFAVTAAGCDLIASSGWPDTASWATEIPAAHPLYRAIAGERRAVCVLKRGDDAVMSGHGLAAHPILTADGERVIGMLKVEMIDAALLDRATPDHMALLSRLLSVALTRQDEHAEQQGVRDVPGVAWMRRSSWKAASAAPQPGATVPADAGVPKDGATRSLWSRRSN